MQVGQILQFCRIFAGHGSYCLPGLHAREAVSHVICVVARSNSIASSTNMYIKKTISATSALDLARDVKLLHILKGKDLV